MYCKVCGFNRVEELIPGMICACCGFEHDVDDYITYEETYLFSRYNNGISEDLRRRIQQLDLNAEKALPLVIVYEILRSIWINEECKWKYNNRGEKPAHWD